MTYEQLIELGEQIGSVNIGLNQYQIDEIKEIPDAFGACSICQCDYDGERVKELKCGHQYHKECISKWLEHKKKCPMCFESVIDD